MLNSPSLGIPCLHSISYALFLINWQKVHFVTSKIFGVESNFLAEKIDKLGMYHGSRGVPESYP